MNQAMNVIQRDRRIETTQHMNKIVFKWAQGTKFIPQMDQLKGILCVAKLSKVVESQIILMTSIELKKTTFTL